MLLLFQLSFPATSIFILSWHTYQMHRWLPSLSVLYLWNPSFISRLGLPRLSYLLSASPYYLSATPPFTSLRVVLSWKVSRTFIYLFFFYSLILYNSHLFNVFILFGLFTASHSISFLVSWYFYGVLDFSTYFLCWFLLIYFFKPLLWTLSNSLAL